MSYHCKKCRLHSETIQCKGCYQFLIDDTEAIDAYLPNPPIPDHEIGCSVVIAHWGDVFAAMSHTKQVLDAKGQASCDIFYWGRDPAIAEWIEAQPWTRNVWSAMPDENYTEFAHHTMNRLADKGQWRRLIPIPADGPDRQSLWCGAIPNYFHSYQYSIQPLVNPVIPDLREANAKKLLNKIIKNHGLQKSDLPILLHPSSTWSAGESQHWPHWPQAVEWLLNDTPNAYLLTGLNDHPYPSHERLIDMTGQLPTNMENFALAKLCGRVITTCNSLSLWTAATNIPAIVMGNGAISSHVNPYRRLIQRDQNRFLPVESSFEAFTQEVQQWM